MRILVQFLQGFEASMAVQLNLDVTGKLPNIYNMFIIDSLEAFLNFHERYKLLHSLFLQIRDIKILNTIVMYEDFDGSIEFYTFVLFGDGCWEGIELSFVNRFRNGKILNNWLYPKRLTDMLNCTLRLCVHDLPPLVQLVDDVNNPKPLSDPIRLRGIEGDMIKIVAKSMNFSLRLLFPNERSLIGFNHNSTGCFGLLENDETEIAIGSFSASHVSHYIFSSSCTYYQSTFIFVVRSDLTYNALIQLVRPFHNEIWRCKFTIFTIAILCIIVVKLWGCAKLREFIFGAENSGPVVNLLTIYLGNPITKLPRRNFARFLLMLWMLLTLLLRNSYQGKLFDVMRVAHRVHLPRTIGELIHEKFYLLASAHLDFYPANLTIIVPTNYISRFNVVNQAKNSKLTTVSMVDNLAHFNSLNWNSSCLTYINEPIYLFHTMMYFQKRSVLKYPFDKKIKLLMSAGIMSHLEKKYVKRKFMKMNQSVYKVYSINNGFSTPIRHISVRSLLPNTDHYITYEGSTTHPGCWESTVWIIVNKPIYITKQELYQLRRLMQGSETSPKAPLGNNARPLQGLHHRTVRTNIDFKRNKNQNSCPSMYKDMYYRANRWSPDTGLLIR
ncbi:uncharacterized protein LOC119667123 [Teleopsis dalmanni]|uniref:uncharacterized protein LOC119667123 n=1 Tax=Teleopsis dalmanni TaxID=139649 RepID=UPI0018CEDFFA|nr:uncharacterized protein LOC119667123 [Teleopsis dalmanni]